jgi:hypothetical protein
MARVSSTYLLRQTIVASFVGLTSAKSTASYAISTNDLDAAAEGKVCAATGLKFDHCSLSHRCGARRSGQLIETANCAVRGGPGMSDHLNEPAVGGDDERSVPSVDVCVVAP